MYPGSIILYKYKFAVLTVRTMQQTRILQNYVQRKQLDKMFTILYFKAVRDHYRHTSVLQARNCGNSGKSDV